MRYGNIFGEDLTSINLHNACFITLYITICFISVPLMLVGLFYKHLHKLNCSVNYVRLACLVISLLFVYPRISYHEFYSSESLFGFQSISRTALLSAQPNEFSDELRNSPPFKTIAVIVNNNELLAKIKNSILFLKLKTKNIKIINKNDYAGYFTTIEIRKTDESRVEIHPLRNYQPNSDLLHIAAGVFKPTLVFNISDLFISKFENKIEIALSGDDQSMLDFVKLLHYLMNITSLVWGTYFYVPLGDVNSLFGENNSKPSGELNLYFIKAETVVPFIALTIVESLLAGRYKIDPILLACNGLAIWISPCLVPLVYNIKGIAPLLILYSFINFKVGYIISVIVALYDIASITNQLYNY